MWHRLRSVLALAGITMALSASSTALASDTVVLRVHHFLSAQATAQAQILSPWCDRIQRESAGSLRCQIFPSMQLGGSPPQLFDQARDGIADIVWTVATYQAGRFPRTEVFELPFMVKSAESGSRALWDYVQGNSIEEFRGVRVLALHLHDGALMHFQGKAPRTLEDLKGLKVRAPTRIGARFIAALGATPVQMPLPAVSEALSKGVVDGAMVPWEGVAPTKLHEVTQFHVDVPAGKPRMSNTVFVIAMNPAKYDNLTAEQRRVIDAASGVELSALAGRAFDASIPNSQKLAGERRNTIGTLTEPEYQRWVKATEQVDDEWVKEVTARGINGTQLLGEARRALERHAR